MARSAPKTKKTPAPKSSKRSPASKAPSTAPKQAAPKKVKAPFDAQKAFEENQRRHASQPFHVTRPADHRNGQVSGRPKLPEQYARFFEVLGETANVSRACEQAGISRDHAYDVRRADPEFAKKWDAAYEQGYLKLEEEAQRRAFEGFERPVYKNGLVVDYVKDYSDTLAMFLLKGRMRKVFGDKQEINVNRGDAPYSRLSDEELDEVINTQLRGDE